MASWSRNALLFAILFLPGIAGASEGEFPHLHLSGNIWGHFAHDLSRAHPDVSANGASRFEVTRTYLNFRAALTESISLRITPDLVAATGTGGNVDGSLLLRLKYAYVSFADVLPGVSLRALMQPTPFIGFSDGIWRYRILGPDLLEHFTGIRSSDLGVSLFGRPAGGFIDYQVLASNGEGYNRQERAEPNAARYKDIAARLTLAPLADGGEMVRGLKFTLFGQYGIREKIVDAHIERTRAMGLLSWQAPGVTLGAGAGYAADDEILEGRIGRKERLLWTSWGWVDLPLHLRAVARYDLDLPEETTDDEVGRRTRLLLGLAYLFTDDVQFIANWERNGFQSPEFASESAPGDTLYLRVAAEF